MITGLITNNKWKGKVIHPIVIRKAKSTAGHRSGALNNPNGTRGGWTLRDELVSLQKKFNMARDGAFDKTKDIEPDEYIDFINEFFKVEQDGQ
ncbi:MAG: hypothetical protein IMF01_09525 [Proteobacteria bacterium]|nr:hypothetical protein [Pseudomonadota bacterium]